MLQKVATARSVDFNLDEETGVPAVQDGETYMIGGILTGITQKTTKSNQIMAFLAIEDLVGTAEVLVFPKDYDRIRSRLVPESRVFIMGRASVEEDRPAKLIFSRICTFDEIPRKLWIRYPNEEACNADFAHLTEILSGSDGTVPVAVMCVEEKRPKALPASFAVDLADGTYERLVKEYGEDRIAFTYRSPWDNRLSNNFGRKR